MRKYSVIVLFIGILFTSFANAEKKGEMNSEETAEQQVLKLEKEKVAALLKGGSVAADWFDRFWSDDISYLGSKGLKAKSEFLGELRSGAMKFPSMQHDDYHVHIYGGGDTAVVTYHGNDVVERNGVVGKRQLSWTTDVFVRKNGQWMTVVHAVIPEM